MKYYSVRVVEAKTAKDAIKAVENNVFDEADALCDVVLPADELSQKLRQRGASDCELPKMEITRLHRLDGDGATKAFFDLAIGDAFIVRGYRIVEGKDGLFVSAPREEGKDGKWYTVVIPMKREVKEGIERLVIELYEDA